ncbi:hypothetical protein [Meiothermus taiwanensis]|nr:hypothetical protein [Meiothermus taiwanensis]
MVISLLSITTSLTVSNRQVATNQGLANRAQFAAESGLLRGLQSYQMALNYLKGIRVDLSGGNAAAVRAAYVQALYRFCYGNSTAGPSLSAFENTLNTMQTGTLCEALPIDPTLSPAEVGNERLAILINPLLFDNTVYNGQVSNPAEYWGRLALGMGGSEGVLGSSDGLEDRYVVQVDFTPRRILIQNSAPVLVFGDPNNAIIATGRVVQGTTVLAERRVARGVSTAGSLGVTSVTIQNPSFSYFAFFVNNTVRSNGSRVVLRDGFTVNGPAFTNGRWAFEQRVPAATFNFGGQFGSAGCEQGAESCTEAQRLAGKGYYLGDGNTTSTFATVPENDSATGLAGINPSFARLRNPAGNFLCRDENGGQVVCADDAPASTWLYDVNWQRNPIPMPGRDAIARFEQNAAGGTPTTSRDDNGNLLRDANGRIVVSNPTDTAGFFIDSSLFTASTSNQASSGWRNVSGGTVVINPATVPQPSASVLQNNTGRYVGTPTVRVYVENGRQRISVTATYVTGYALAVQQECYTPPPPGGGGGGGGVWLPELQKLADYLFNLGSMAHAQSFTITITCSRGGTPRYRTYWTNNPNDPNIIQNPRPTLRQTITVVYEVDEQGQVSKIADNSAGVQTLPSGGLILSNSAVPRSAIPPIQGPPPGGRFNGVIYSSGNLAVRSVSDVNNASEASNIRAVASYQQLSIAARNHILIQSNLRYQSPIPDPLPADPGQWPRNLLGLYAGQDVRLDPQGYLSITSNSNRNLLVDGVVMAQNGEVRGHNSAFDACANAADLRDGGSFRVFGGVIQNRLGAINCGTVGGVFRGYRSNHTYDRRLLDPAYRPPSFPEVSNATLNTTVNTVLQGNAGSAGSQGFWRLIGQ